MSKTGQIELNALVPVLNVGAKMIRRLKVGVGVRRMSQNVNNGIGLRMSDREERFGVTA